VVLVKTIGWILSENWLIGWLAQKAEGRDITVHRQVRYGSLRLPLLPLTVVVIIGVDCLVCWKCNTTNNKKQLESHFWTTWEFLPQSSTEDLHWLGLSIRTVYYCRENSVMSVLLKLDWLTLVYNCMVPEVILSFPFLYPVPPKFSLILKTTSFNWKK
jgi:hypothetical protein